MDNKEYFTRKIPEIFKELKTSKKGLDKKEARQRLYKYGKNSLTLKSEISIFKIFISQFKNALIIILLIAAIASYAISIFYNHQSYSVDAILILIIVIINGIIGFIQDYKAEKSIEALKRLQVPKAIVLRDGKEQKINSEYLVPGDIILLTEGSEVPADARIIEEASLRVDESSLTGESIGVSKRLDILAFSVPLADRHNMVYMGTSITRGIGKAVVVATGDHTEIGHIAKDIQIIKSPPTAFENEISKFSKKITIFIVGVIIFIAIVQMLIQHQPILDLILVSISLAVAAIPEGLPAVITLTFAIATKKMLKKNSLARRLPIVEGLGAVDVICSDKTGTLTENVMTVSKIYNNTDEITVTGTAFEEKGHFKIDGKTAKLKDISLLLNCGMLCNDSSVSYSAEKKLQHLGDPTEIALNISAMKAGLTALKDQYSKIKEIPFTSERKMMTKVFKKGKEKISFTKGAPEILIKRCNFYYEKGKIRKLTQNKIEEIKKANEDMAANALRVLGFAYKGIKDNKLNKKDLESNMIFLGLQGMLDPPRKGVKESINTCKRAGIKVKMITGDHKIVAIAIAKEIGLGTNAIEGEELSNMSKDELSRKIDSIDIFARVNPQDKVKILNALQEKGYVVAMTGDGVNDAPAIKKADVGISMGEQGTDVARETSSIILLDDNFSSIITAVEEGRNIFSNIRKFVNYLFTSNFAEVFVIFFISLIGYLPLKAVQILWINLLTDGFPALALAVDPPVKGLMDKKPRNKSTGILNKRLKWLTGVIGMKKTIVLVIIFFIGLRISENNLKTAQTMLFTGFVLYELVRIAVIRQQESLTWWSNKWLIGAIALSLGMQFLVVYTPLKDYFGTISLGILPLSILAGGILIGWITAIFLTKIIEKHTPDD